MRKQGFPPSKWNQAVASLLNMPLIGTSQQTRQVRTGQRRRLVDRFAQASQPLLGLDQLDGQQTVIAQATDLMGVEFPRTLVVLDGPLQVAPVLGPYRGRHQEMIASVVGLMLQGGGQVTPC